MTSDFDNDEISDTAFPVNFTDDTVSLDLFGICIKKEPRDVVHASGISENTEPENDVYSTHSDVFDAQDESSQDQLPDIDDFSIIDPDSFTIEDAEPDTFAIQEEVKPEASVSLSESTDQIVFEEMLPDSSPAQDFEKNTDTPDTDIPAASHASGAESSDFNTVDFDDFFTESSTDTQSHSNSANTQPEYSEPPSVISTDVEIVFEDYQPDEAASIVETDDEHAEPDSASDVHEAIEEASSGYGDVILDSADKEEIFIEPRMSDTVIESHEIVTSDFENLDISDFNESMLPSDQDFSSFLDDLNTSTKSDAGLAAIVPGSASDDLDLDSFISSFNETGGASPEEHVKLFDDVEPVDLDLEFDEKFIEDSQKIKAIGSSVTESEFFNLEFGVELVDETSPEFINDESSLSFDTSDFDTILSTGDVSASPLPSDSSTKLESATEFDDFLSKLDSEPGPVQSKKESSSTSTRVKPLYALSVSEDDGMAPVAAPVPESSSIDDDIAVSLWDRQICANNEKKNLDAELISDAILAVAVEADSFEEEEFLDIPVDKDYNMTDNNQDFTLSESIKSEECVSLEFDDISAVEQELTDLTPETGDTTVITNDKSTELLMRIADELSSIKEEISTLKNELAVFKAGSPVQGLIPEQDNAVQQESTGFFTDDDPDEAIALTGDELNNILITADFTEEKSEEAFVDDIEPVSNESDDITISTESGSLTEENENDFSTESSGIEVQEDVEFSEFTEEKLLVDETLQEEEAAPYDFGESEIPDTLPESFLEDENVSPPFDLEVSHVNSLEEDTSYLEGSETEDSAVEDISIQEPDLEIIDFDDEKLEEPALDEFNLDLSDLDAEFPSVQEIPVPADDMQDTPSASETSFNQTDSQFDLDTASSADTESDRESIQIPLSDGLSESTVDEFSIDFAADSQTFSQSDDETIGETKYTEEQNIDFNASTDLPQDPIVEIESTDDISSATDSKNVFVTGVDSIPTDLKEEIKSVLSYMDQLLESLPEEKIEEFARSEHFEVYKKLFGELGIS